MRKTKSVAIFTGIAVDKGCDEMTEHKRIIIFTMGTRGDVQPYIFLAKALNESGFNTVIATHPCWKTLVEEAGIRFAPIGPDIDITYEAAAIRGKSANWMLGVIKTMKFVFNIIENASDGILSLCRTADLVIASHSHVGAIEAEACHVPTVSVTLQTEVIPQVSKPKTKRQIVTKKILNALINPLMVRPYNKIRKKYNLKPVKSIDEIMSPYLNLIPISSYVIPQNPYWEEKNRVVGYWYDEDKNYKPSAELHNFLNAGSKPIILALGAMSFESSEEKDKLNIFINAFKKTGMRAVIQGFNATLKDFDLPKTMIKAGSIPHSWLFRQGYCVIHHGGFGTSASAMLAGIPSIVIPHVLDQFLWADKIYKLNAGMKPINAKNLNEQVLTETIESLKKNYNEIQNSTLLLSEKMRAENGLKKAVALIEEVYDTKVKVKQNRL